jgi:hypothetical protein
MSICPNKSSEEWKVLIENIKLYMIELDMFKDDYDVEQHGLVSYFRLGTGEIPNPVQSMRLLIQSDEKKKKRFEEYLKHSKREDNYKWRIKSLPKNIQDKILTKLSIITFAKRKGESKLFIDKLKSYLDLTK